MGRLDGGLDVSRCVTAWITLRARSRAFSHHFYCFDVRVFNILFAVTNALLLSAAVLSAVVEFVDVSGGQPFGQPHNDITHTHNRLAQCALNVHQFDIAFCCIIKSLIFVTSVNYTRNPHINLYLYIY